MNFTYQIGDQVFYPYLGLHGTVTGYVNSSDPQDLRSQGPRYEVTFKKADGQTWSIKEHELLRRGQK